MKKEKTYSISITEPDYFGLTFHNLPIAETKLLFQLLVNKDIEFQMFPTIED